MNQNSELEQEPPGIEWHFQSSTPLTRDELQLEEATSNFKI